MFIVEYWGNIELCEEWKNNTYIAAMQENFCCKFMYLSRVFTECLL